MNLKELKVWQLDPKGYYDPFQQKVFVTLRIVESPQRPPNALELALRPLVMTPTSIRIQMALEITLPIKSVAEMEAQSGSVGKVITEMLVGFSDKGCFQRDLQNKLQSLKESATPSLSMR